MKYDKKYEEIRVTNHLETLRSNSNHQAAAREASVPRRLPAREEGGRGALFQLYQKFVVDQNRPYHDTEQVI